jgi:hypothetical protein
MYETKPFRFNVTLGVNSSPVEFISRLVGKMQM